MAEPKDILTKAQRFHGIECDTCGAPKLECQCDEVDLSPEQQEELDTCGEKDWRQYLKK